MNEYIQNAEYKTWSIAFGVGLAVLGLLTISVAGFTSLVSVVFIGLILIIRGIVDVIHGVSNRQEKGFWWRLFGGTLSLVIGALLVSRPVVGMLSLTFLISVLLISNGLFKTIAAPIEHGNQWGWIMFGGVVSLILGFMVLSGWPVSAIWFIGLLVGSEILIQGLLMISTPFAFKPIHGVKREIPAH